MSPEPPAETPGPGQPTGAGPGPGPGPGAEDDDWAWRRRIRSNPQAHGVYRVLVAVLGLVIVAAGLVLVPAPGPGWVIVFVGVAIWASEFDWARRLLHWGRARLSAWTGWMRVQPWWVKAAVTLATLLVVLGLAYGYLRWLGPPGLLPDSLEHWLSRRLTR